MSNDSTSKSAPKTKPGDNEEPEITQEDSVPSDGKDEVGEKMIEELGRDKGVEQPGHPAPD